MSVENFLFQAVIFTIFFFRMTASAQRVGRAMKHSLKVLTRYIDIALWCILSEVFLLSAEKLTSEKKQKS